MLIAASDSAKYFDVARSAGRMVEPSEEPIFLKAIEDIK